MKSDSTIKIFLSVIIFSLLVNAFANAQSLPSVTTVTSPTSRDLYSVYFSSATNGVAVGDSVVLHTTDGGTTWTAVTPPVNGTLEGVYFPTASTGYIVGIASNGSSKTIVLQTTDGGTIWTNVAADTLFENLHAVFFTSADTGFAVGEGVVLKTVNSGTFWSYIANDNYSYQSVFFPGKDTGYAAGDEFIRLPDLGTKKDSLTDINGTTGYDQAGPILSIYYPSPETGYICGESGQLYRVTKAGSVLTSLSFNAVNLNSIFFMNTTQGFTTGKDIYYTGNAGTSWSSISNPTGDSLRSINFAKGSAIGFAVGDAGAIVKIDATSTTTGISQAMLQGGLSVYPNPSDGSFTVQATGSYQVTVMNSLGQELYTQPASDALAVVLPNAVSGIYYVQVSSAGANAVQKIIIK